MIAPFFIQTQQMITGVAGCGARATSSHAATPPMSVMNSG
jgi:hypothetical protein